MNKYISTCKCIMLEVVEQYRDISNIFMYLFLKLLQQHKYNYDCVLAKEILLQNVLRFYKWKEKFNFKGIIHII